MPVYWRQQLSGAKTARKPPLGPLVGGKLAKRSRVASILKAQDFVAPLGSRVIATNSLRGENGGWLVPDTNPDAATQTHPLVDVEREILRSRCNVTPGHFLSLSVLTIPSGQTQKFIAAGNYDPGGLGGRFKVEITWYDADGNNTTTTKTVTLPASGLQFGASPGDHWVSVDLVMVPTMTPAFLVPTDNVAVWSRHVGADITVKHIDGARVVDAVLLERATAIAREADDNPDLWVSHLFAQQHPDGVGSVQWPYQRFSETTPDGNPRGGTWQLQDTHDAQHLRLGPQLIHWTAYNEADATVGGAVVSATTTSASYVRMVDGAATTWSASEPGWSISCGAYARRRDGNHDYWAVNDGEIPVVVGVYGGGDTTDGTLKLQASADSYIEVPITAASPHAWNLAYGHLVCGRGPGQPSVVQAFIKRDSGLNNFEVSNLVVHHAGQYAKRF